MRRHSSALMLGVFICGLSVLALAQRNTQTPGAKPPDTDDRTIRTIEGELIDMHCYVFKNNAHGEKHVACAEKCAASGIPAGLLVNNDSQPLAMTLMTNPKPLAQHMGKTIRVTGKASHSAMAMQPDTIEVKSGNDYKEIKLDDQMHK